ncbi:MAG: C-type lectin domain-containing protein [Eubacteriales bacterium]|nr:C-type lectin domain-containing protein [Eubacteriales bacterium]
MKKLSLNYNILCICMITLSVAGSLVMPVQRAEAASGTKEEAVSPDAWGDYTPEKAWFRVTGTGEQGTALLVRPEETSEELLRIPEGEEVYVEALTDRRYGYTTYNGISGWINTGHTRIVTTRTEEQEVSEPRKEDETDEDQTEKSEIHVYEFCYTPDDQSWSTAFRCAKENGGYLARIDSEAEFEVIVNQISQMPWTQEMVMFQIGGRRDADSEKFYWVDEENQCFGPAINESGSWAEQHWHDGEPSLQNTRKSDGSITEEYQLDLYNVSGVWKLNDSTDDIVSWYPEYSGKVGYIVEYEK